MSYLGLLKGNSGLTLEGVLYSMEKQFSNAIQTKRLTLEIEEQIVTGDKLIRMWWGRWPVAVYISQKSESRGFYEELTEKQTDEISRDKFLEATWWIRIAFGRDVNNEYTNEAIFVMEFFESLYSAELYDLHKDEFI